MKQNKLLCYFFKAGNYQRSGCVRYSPKAVEEHQNCFLQQSNEPCNLEAGVRQWLVMPKSLMQSSTWHKFIPSISHSVDHELISFTLRKKKGSCRIIHTHLPYSFTLNMASSELPGIGSCRANFSCTKIFLLFKIKTSLS